MIHSVSAEKLKMKSANCNRSWIITINLFNFNRLARISGHGNKLTRRSEKPSQGVECSWTFRDLASKATSWYKCYNLMKLNLQCVVQINAWTRIFHKLYHRSSEPRAYRLRDHPSIDTRRRIAGGNYYLSIYIATHRACYIGHCEGWICKREKSGKTKVPCLLGPVSN